jgi:hypothetical protein
LEKKKVEQFCPEVGVGGKLAQIMYIHVSKCKNDKTKERNSKKENTHQKKKACRVAQGEGPEFKPQYHKKKTFEQ